MVWHKFAAAIALCAAFGSIGYAQTPPPPATAEEQTGAEPTSEVMQMLGDRYRRMTVPVTINGEGPFQFMIDTGAQATVLSHKLADQLQLDERETATLIGMASRREVQTTTIDDLGFGSRSHLGATAALVQEGNIGGADGILGLDSLQDRRVLLDFENGMLEVANDDDQRNNRGYDIIVRARRIEGQLIIARADIDGVRTSIIVDTGAQGSLGNEALYRRLRRAQQLLDTQMTDINGVQASGSVRIARKLEMGRAQLTHVPITFAESPTFAAMGLDDAPALILGMAELRLFKRVAIDFASRRVLFDLPDRAQLPGREAFTSY